MFWLDRINPQLRIVWSGATPKGWIEPSRRLYDNELVLVNRGACTITLGMQDIHCVAPFFLIVPPNTLHTTRQQGSGLIRHCLHFDWVPTNRPTSPNYCVFHPGILRPGLIHPTPHWVPRGLMYGPVPDVVALETLMAELLRNWGGTDPVRQVACRGLLLAILLLLLTPRRRGDAPAPHHTLSLASRVRDLLDGPVSQQDSIQDLLTSLGHSYAHLCRLFRRRYGLTPVRYLNALRVERAKSLLRKSGLTVAEVSTQAGFNSPQYFSRLFHACTGMTPCEFRANEWCSDDKA